TWRAADAQNRNQSCFFEWQMKPQLTTGPSEQPAQIEVMNARSKGRFHDIEIEMMTRAVDNDGLVAEHRRQAGGITRIRRRTGYTPAPKRSGEGARGVCIDICDQDAVLRAGFVEIANDNAADSARAAEHDEARSGPG